MALIKWRVEGAHAMHGLLQRLIHDIFVSIEKNILSEAESNNLTIE